MSLGRDASQAVDYMFLMTPTLLPGTRRAPVSPRSCSSPKTQQMPPEPEVGVMQIWEAPGDLQPLEGLTY